MTDFTMLSARPRISREGFAEVLRAHDSPAAPVAGRLWDLVKSYGLDPAVALAFFKHESTYGTKGVAIATHNWGNIKVGSWAIREGYADTSYITPDGRPFLVFRRRENEEAGEEWLRSLQTWCELIYHTYIHKWGLHTVSQVLTKYLGPGDAPKAYAADVNNTVEVWMQHYPYQPEGDPGPAGVAQDLAAELKVLAERAAGLARMLEGD